MPKDRPYHHGNLKEALVLGGLELLEEVGLEGLSLRAIAARVGVSHTAPKNHFGSLKGLLTAIATEGFRRHAAFMREGLDASASREDRLSAALDGYVRFAQTHPHLFALMFSPVLCNHSDADLRAAGRDSYSVLEEISRGLDWDKANAPHGDRRTEMMLWSVAHGYATLALADQFAPPDGTDTPLAIADVVPVFRYKD